MNCTLLLGTVNLSRSQNISPLCVILKVPDSIAVSPSTWQNLIFHPTYHYPLLGSPSINLITFAQTSQSQLFYFCPSISVFNKFLLLFPKSTENDSDDTHSWTNARRTEYYLYALRLTPPMFFFVWLISLLCLITDSLSVQYIISVTYRWPLPSTKTTTYYNYPKQSTIN